MPNVAQGPGSVGPHEAPVDVVPRERHKGCSGTGHRQLWVMTAPAVPCSRAGP